nr:hypothetical protein CFP56_44292 [Quercus suber]
MQRVPALRLPVREDDVQKAVREPRSNDAQADVLRCRSTIELRSCTASRFEKVPLLVGAPVYRPPINTVENKCATDRTKKIRRLATLGESLRGFVGIFRRSREKREAMLESQDLALS